MKIFEVIGSHYYHGTARSDLSFRPDRIVYFARSLADAIQHAQADAQVEGGTPRVIEAQLDIQHAVRVNEREMQDLNQYPKFVARLRRLGHDAVLGRMSENEIAMLDASRIRVTRVMDVSAMAA